MISFKEVEKIFKDRTTLEKILLAAATVLSLALIGVIIPLAVLSKNNKEATVTSSVCRTESCMAIGCTLRQSMDQKVDPCEDFYSYCCGGWLNSHSVPSDMGQYGINEKLREDVLSKVHGLLSTTNASQHMTIGVENAVKFYKSCMDTDAIEIRSTKPLLKFLNEIGSWPVIDTQWSAAAYDGLSAMAQIQLRTGSGIIIPLMIGADAKNTSYNILQLDEPSTSLSKEVLLKPDLESSQNELMNYKKFFIQIAMLLGAKENGLEKEFDEMIQFETELVKMMSPGEETKDIKQWYNKMSIKDMKKNIPEIDWLWYLQMITNSTLLPLGERKFVTESENVIVRGLPYIEKVSKFLQNSSHSRQIANYLGWRVIFSKIRYLPAKFSKALQTYSKDTGYTQDSPERWKICSSSANTAFSYAIAYLYVKKYFQEEVKVQILQMVLDLRIQFEDILHKSDWMDDITRKAALLKLQAMKINLGYPDWIIDEEALTEYYIKRPNMTDDIFENTLVNSHHSTQDAIRKLREKNEMKQWTMTPVTVNAGYNRNTNGITFPAAFLQKPLFDSSLPSFYNYAAIGSIIGHEITHGFDNEGRHRNASGEIHNWWSNKSEAVFQKRAECFVNQYNSYKLNGKKTLAENIADNGGLRQAYQAFSRWKENDDVQSLPGLEEFTPEQMFFLAYGSIWCTKYRPEALEIAIQYAEHSPSPYRLKGTVSNSEAFAKAFHCKKNSAENPENRCIVW